MVRTKADGGGGSSGSRKVVAAAAPRKALVSGAGPSTEGSPAGKGKYAGGNPACPRPTPDWQKGIQGFFASPEKSKDKENEDPQEDSTEKAGSSKVDEEPESGSL